MSKQAGYTVWRWLKAQGCDQAAKEVEEKLAITHDLETFAGSLVPRELEDFLANQPTLSERLAVAAKDDKFVEFEASVTAKGFYKDAGEGTLEHLERRSKLLQKYMERTGVSLGEPATAAAGNAKAEEEAEDKKSLGNAAMTGKDYDLAVQFYTEAIALSSTGPNSHVYYSNRAAAYCSQSRYANAISDCEAALKLVPDYSKAAARLGLANFYTENYEAAIAAYERAVAIEPDNKSHSDALAKAKGKLAKKQSGLPVGRSAPSSSSSSSSAAAPPNMADLMAGMGGMGGMGAGGLGSLLSDPNMMKMAEKMMQDPKMMQKAQEMMSNPEAMQKAMSMLGGGGGGGAGGLDMSALAGMMGGADGGKKKFSGFEE